MYVLLPSVLGQTKGPPPSPVQVSTPSSPPAQINDSPSLKCDPSLVVRNWRSQSFDSTIFNSTCFNIFWYDPSSPYIISKIKWLISMFFVNIYIFYEALVIYNIDIFLPNLSFPHPVATQFLVSYDFAL